MEEIGELLTRQEVQDLGRFQRTTLYRLMGYEGFPKPLSLGPRLRRWRRDEVMAWLSARERGGTTISRS